MASYNNQHSKGDAIIHNGRYVVIRAVRVEKGETQYKISVNGRVRWKSAALIDRDASDYDPDAFES